MQNKYQEAADILLKEHGIIISKIRSTMSGVAYHDTNRIECPKPKSATSFAILAHEIGHRALNHNGNGKSCMAEYQAEMFTIAQFKRFGFAMPHKVKDRINRHIAYGLAQALNRNMCNIPSELKPYKKYLWHSTAHTMTIKNGKRTYGTKQVYRVRI